MEGNQPSAPLDDNAAHQREKEQFLKDFQGAHVALPTTFHNRSVIRAYRRMYMALLRNWHLATSLARAKLKDPGVAVKVQDSMLDKLNSILKNLDQKLKFLDGVAAAEGVDFTHMEHGRSFSDKVVIFGPVAAKFRTVLMQADQVLDKAAVIYSFGGMPEKEHEDLKFEIKKMLHGADTSVRNFRIMVLKRVNSEGGARPGYNGTKADAPKAEGAPQAPAAAESTSTPEAVVAEAA